MSNETAKRAAEAIEKFRRYVDLNWAGVILFDKAIEAVRQAEREAADKVWSYRDTEADTPAKRAAGTILVALFEQFGIEFGMPFVESAARVIDDEFAAEREAAAQETVSADMFQAQLNFMSEREAWQQREQQREQQYRDALERISKFDVLSVAGEDNAVFHIKNIARRALASQPAPAAPSREQELVDVVHELMSTPIPHAVGCSHRPETCNCHRSRAINVLNKYGRALAEPSAKEQE